MFFAAGTRDVTGGAFNGDGDIRIDGTLNVNAGTVYNVPGRTFVNGTAVFNVDSDFGQLSIRPASIVDGPSLLKELRKTRPDLKIIFISGYAEDAFRKNLPDDEVFHFLPKPFSLKQLAVAVKETLGQ